MLIKVLQSRQFIHTWCENDTPQVFKCNVIFFYIKMIENHNAVTTIPGYHKISVPVGPHLVDLGIICLF